VRGGRAGALVLAVAAIALLPWVLDSSYWRSILIVSALNVVLAMSLNLILGYAGQLNLGQAAFYGIGAYTSTLLVKLAGIPYWIAFLGGTAAAGLAGVALSAFAVRLKGHYLGIASLGFALVTYNVLMSWVELTQGPLGIYGIAPPPAWEIPGLGRIRFNNPVNLFYLVAGFALLVYLLLDNLVRSPVGETLRAVREDEVSAASLGVDCPRWKVFAFGVGSAIAGASGCFYASFVGTLVPDSFFVTESFNMLAMAIVGGLGTMIGPVIGAVVLTVLPELLRGIGDLRLVVYGVALTLVVLFVPGGLVEGWAVLRARLLRRAASPEAAE
jgi:branched-chain amino acid transport system permease protein